MLRAIHRGVSLKLVAISVRVYLSIVVRVAAWATVKVRGPAVELVFCAHLYLLALQ